MIKIVEAGINEIPIIQKLSKIVWPITFSSILSQEQIAYMMEMMYSTQSLTKQIEEDKHKYILAKDKTENHLAYLSYQNNIENSYTKIHKIYVLPTAQGKGIGKLLIDYVKNEAIDLNNTVLTLNVNRHNKALDFYKRLGFTISDIEDIDIGDGFLMEDYALKMQIENKSENY